MSLGDRWLCNLARDPERYDPKTDAARQLGAFGSPTFTVGQEGFWGDARLEEAQLWAGAHHPALTRWRNSEQALA